MRAQKNGASAPPCQANEFDRRFPDALLLFRRNDRDEKVRSGYAPDVDAVFGAGVVVGMVVRIRCAAPAVAWLHIEPQLVTFLEHHRRRPDFDLAFDDLIRFEPPALVM